MERDSSNSTPRRSESVRSSRMMDKDDIPSMPSLSRPATAPSASVPSSSASEKAQNIQVVVRCRPANAIETGGMVVNTDNHSRTVTVHASKNATKTFTFDGVLPPSSSQEDVFGSHIRHLLDEVLTGYNCTIFAYGQTSTGKTFTMEGDRSDPEKMGVVPRSIRYIFEALERMTISEAVSEFTVKVSVLELYNEELFDLLAPATAPSGPASSSAAAAAQERRTLRILNDAALAVPGRKGVVVQGLEEAIVRSCPAALDLLAQAADRRRVAETNMNRQSSRSHLITSIMVHVRESTPDGEDLIKVGKLNLVDLAGSENVGRSGAVDKRAKEAGSINQSLLTLGRVITSLTEHTPHIPYRESKLTHLLKDSLGGTTKTCVIATISPAGVNLEETLSTLDYAHRAKNIKNKPEINQKMTQKAYVKELVADYDRLKSQIKAMAEKSGMYLPMDQYEEMVKEAASNSAEIERLEAAADVLRLELETMSGLFSVKDKELEDEKSGHGMTRSALESTKQELNALTIELGNTRVQLHKEQIVLQEHRSAVMKMRQQSKSLLNGLTTSLSDVDGLRAKIARKDSVESQHKSSVEQIQSNLISSISSLSSECESQLTSQLKTYDSMSSSLSVFQSVKQTDSVALLGQISSLAECLTGFTEQVSALISSASSSSVDRLKVQATALESQHMESLKQIASSLSTDIQSAASSLSSSLTQSMKQVSELKQLLVSHSSANIAALQSLHQSFEAAVQTMNETVANHVKQQIAVQQEKRQVASAAHKKRKASSMEQEIMLQERIRILIEDHCSKQRDMMEEEYSESQSDSIAQSNAMAALSDSVLPPLIASSLSSVVNKKVSSIVEAEEQFNSGVLSSSLDLISSQMEGIQSSIDSDLVTPLACRYSEQLESMSTAHYTQMMESVIEPEHQAMESLNSAHSNAVQSIIHESVQSRQIPSLVQSAESIFQSVEQASSSIGKLADADKALSFSFTASQVQKLESMSNDVHAFVNGLQWDVRTGSTPIKRDNIQVPSALVLPRPDAQVLQEAGYAIEFDDAMVDAEEKEEDVQLSPLSLPSAPSSSSSSVPALRLAPASPKMASVSRSAPLSPSSGNTSRFGFNKSKVSATSKQQQQQMQSQQDGLKENIMPQ